MIVPNISSDRTRPLVYPLVPLSFDLLWFISIVVVLKTKSAYIARVHKSSNNT